VQFLFYLLAVNLLLRLLLLLHRRLKKLECLKKTL
jgi:hypothetical protein